MAEQIRDGTGSGFLAKVDSENRLLVHADQNSEEHNVSHQFKRAYIANTAKTANTLTLATGNTYDLLFVENNDPARLINIHDIRVSVNTNGAVVRIIRNATRGSISDNNAILPSNLNFGSERAALGVFHSWDEVGTNGISGLSSGTVLEVHILAIGDLPFLYEEAVILAQGDNITVQIVNGTGGDIEAAATIRFFYEDL